MKKALLLLAVLLCCIFTTNTFGQEVKREGNNFTQVQSVAKSTDTQTIYTYTIKDTTYPIWITKNGRCYIIRTSKNGKEYKQYLPEEVSKAVCAELGVEYIEKQ